MAYCCHNLPSAINLQRALEASANGHLTPLLLGLQKSSPSWQGAHSSQDSHFTMLSPHGVHTSWWCSHFTGLTFHGAHTSQCSHFTELTLHGAHTSQSSHFIELTLHCAHTSWCSHFPSVPQTPQAVLPGNFFLKGIVAGCSLCNSESCELFLTL